MTKRNGVNNLPSEEFYILPFFFEDFFKVILKVCNWPFAVITVDYCVCVTLILFVAEIT